MRDRGSCCEPSLSPHEANPTYQGGRPLHKNMVRVPGGTLLMGSNDFYSEERPVHRVAVDGFWMDEHPVTNAEFRRFVKDSGYVTVAERPLDPASYPEADPSLPVPGSLVFRKTSGPVDLRNVHNLVDLRPWGQLALSGGAGH
jgi:formylglycine-generating enzyme required for sulfatase activity